MPKQKHRPVWEGPESTGPNGGITQSLLNRFLCCRERFRIHTIVGLRPKKGFNHRIEFGNMWHLCEESIAGEVIWLDALKDYAGHLLETYLLDTAKIDKYYRLCKLQFPIYIDFWKKDSDTKKRVSIYQEERFNVPYKLPSGRIVRLRGKWDSVDYIGKVIYLQENKTKGDIDEQNIAKQLSFDLQTMLYLIALKEHLKINSVKGKVKGVRYNVVRRPLSGGKGTIRQHKPTKKNPTGESSNDFYNRVESLIIEDPAHYFMRWKVEVIGADINRFKLQFLDPVLENLCDWWEWVETNKSPFIRNGGMEQQSRHWRTPFGIWNVLLGGGAHDLDEYISTGSQLGLEKVDTLFPEL